MADDLQGFEELDRALRRLGPVLAVREMRGAIRLGANMIRRRARENLKGVATPRSGRLAAGLLVRVPRPRRGDRDLVAMISPSRATFYGMFLEFGTAHARARPWFQPAIDAVGQEIPARMARHLSRRLARIAREVAR